VPGTVAVPLQPASTVALLNCSPSMLPRSFDHV
jgi:hypothetical protein